MVPEVIVIGKESGRIREQLREVRIITFPTLREFDLWRHQQRSAAQGPTIEIDVMAALREVGFPRTDLEGPVRDAIEYLCLQSRICSLEELWAVSGGSESTFRRRWRELIPESPKKFLARVRLLHARRLIEQLQVPTKEAAHRAGFEDVYHLKQAIKRRAAQNADQRA